MHFFDKLYLTTGNLSKKSYAKKICQPLKVKGLPNCQFERELTLKTLQSMLIDKASDLFY